MRQAVQIGAGNIGRGFLGQLFFEGGYETTFLDANCSLVAQLDQRGTYPLRLVSDVASETCAIGNLTARSVLDAEDAIDAIAHADIVSTAVGAGNLPRLGPLLARAITARARTDRRPLNILLCENQWHAATVLRDAILPDVAAEALDFFHDQIGLVETVIGRMVPAPTAALLLEDPLLVAAEHYKELPVAAEMLRGDAPTLPGLILADNFEAFEARKLYLHNMSHAALAYLGCQRGHEYVWQCAADSVVASVCRDALRETASAVSARYGFELAELKSFSADLMRRFTNKALGDTVARVAADPLRKLRKSDRLIGAAILCQEMGRNVGPLAHVIAAAILYDNPADASAVALQSRRRSDGDANILQSICGLKADSALFDAICDELAHMGK